MRNKIVAPLLVVFGLFMLYGGFSQLNSDNVTCGGKDMRNGDTCREVHRRSGHTTRRSFDQQRAENHTSGLVLLGLGSAMIIGGLVWSVVAYRSRPAASQNYYAPPSGQPYYPPPGQPYYPPPGQPYYPPPGGGPPGGAQSYPPPEYPLPAYPPPAYPPPGGPPPGGPSSPPSE